MTLAALRTICVLAGSACLGGSLPGSVRIDGPSTDACGWSSGGFGFSGGMLGTVGVAVTNPHGLSHRRACRRIISVPQRTSSSAGDLGAGGLATVDLVPCAAASEIGTRSEYAGQVLALGSDERTRGAAA